MYQTTGSLCGDFCDLAIKTWHRIRYGHFWGLKVLEESITDFNLLDLKITHPLKIFTDKFSKPRESKEGADWEWWLGSRGIWLGLRIQAKILDPQKMKYKHLGHKNVNGRQIDLLINYSNKGKYPKIPLYIFYNYWNVSKFDPPWLCRTYPKSVEMLGCSVSEAQSVRSILNHGSDKLQDISQIMYPWSCLVCCVGFSINSRALPSRAFDFIMGAFSRFMPETRDFDYEKERFVKKEAPSYVYNMMEGRSLTEDEWSEIAVNRITVIYETEETKRNYNPFIFR